MLKLTSMEIAKSIKFLTVFLMLFAFIFSIAGSWGSVETIYHFQTKTAPCPASEAQTGCPLLSEHVSSWQEMFITTLPDTRTALSMLFILSLLVIFAALGSHFKKQLQNQADLVKQFFYRQNPELSLFNYLKLAFARGILNPKIY